MKLFILLFLFSFSLMYSQNYIYDIDSKQPIKSVHINYAKDKGLITNKDGFFNLLYNEGIDTLNVSHLSYNTKKIVRKSLKKNDTIFLKKRSIELNVVEISSFNPKNIIIKGIKRIESNYINIAYNQLGFLRQTVEEEGKGIEMIEVAFTNYYNKKQSLATNITNARRTENYSKIDFNITGGVFSMIEKGDFVKRKAQFLNLENIDSYIFTYQGKIKHDNLEVYKIKIESKEEKTQNYRKSYVYIDVKSYAFVKIENYFDEKKLRKLETINLKAVTKRQKKKVLYILRGGYNTIKYKKLKNDKWALSYLNVNNVLKGLYKKESYMYDVNINLVINDIVYDKVVPVKTNYNISKGFNKAIKKIKNVGYWGDNYKFSLSDEDKRILTEIEQRK